MTTPDSIGFLRAMRTLALFAFLPLLVGAACSDKAEPEVSTTDVKVPESFWVNDAPAAAQDVTAVRAEAKDGAEVTVIGRIQDYRDGQAQFFLADRALMPCNDRQNDSCPTPWDYCCEDRDKLEKGLLTVELREPSGKKLLKSSLRGFHGFEHLKEAVVRGKTHVDDAGNVVVVASALHVR
ncbi:MAG: hypothetical protein KDC95_05035 [Planctomycetes bacterium]|nr:hypothetical protein [Planctomycetota bacterium]